MVRLSHDKHEDIINTVRQAWTHWILDNETDNSFFIIEHSIAKWVQPGLQNESLRADAYIGLDDGFPCMILEVGRMQDGKWSHLGYDIDKKPARVLRVGFDRHAYMLHQRDTERERAFFSFLNTFLEKDSIQRA